MRTTLRIEDSLLRELKTLARKKNVPLTRIVDIVLHSGLRAMRETASARKPYQEDTINMGKPHIPLDKALSISTAMEDDEVVRKTELGK